MDLRKLKTLIELVESSGIAELEIQEGEERVRITRAVPPSAGVAPPVKGAVVDTVMLELARAELGTAKSRALGSVPLVMLAAAVVSVVAEGANATPLVLVTTIAVERPDESPPV